MTHAGTPEQPVAPGLVKGFDFDTARITGWVPHAQRRGLNPELDVPLASHVRGTLWQGGCMQGIRLPDDFKYVVSLYPWEQYELGPETARWEYRMYDSLEQQLDQIEQIAHQVVNLAEAGKTLVHCQAGLNRSGLVAARALMLVGMTADEAIDHVRSVRSPLVLCNETFEDYLRGLDAS